MLEYVANDERGAGVEVLEVRRIHHHLTLGGEDAHVEVEDLEHRRARDALQCLAVRGVDGPQPVSDDLVGDRVDLGVRRVEEADLRRHPVRPVAGGPVAVELPIPHDVCGGASLVDGRVHLVSSASRRLTITEFVGSTLAIWLCRTTRVVSGNSTIAGPKTAMPASNLVPS